MRVNLTSIDQSMSVSDGSTKTYITLEVAPGTSIRAAVDENTVATIIGLLELPQSPVEEPEDMVSPGVIAVDGPTVYSPPAETQAEGPLVDWTEKNLPPQVKSILESAGIPNEVEASELDKLLGYVYDQIAGSKTVAEPVSTKRRTVPSDDAGYPIPPGGISEPDPGEVVDDDGVESI